MQKKSLRDGKITSSSRKRHIGSKKKAAIFSSWIQLRSIATWILRPHNYIFSCFFLFTAFLYFHNLSHDVYSGDTGDLVTAAYVFGVPHPPGYPLLTFLGFLCSRLPLALPVVTKVGFVSVVSCLLGVVLFYRFSLQVTRNTLISILTTALLAFSYEFWIVGELPEVFALNNFFAIALFYFSYSFFTTKLPISLYLFSFLAGLSLTNQLQIVVVFPFVFLLVFYHFDILWQNKKRLLFTLFCFVLGFLPYIYIPIAAAHHPVINWDNASNFSNFLHLVLRQDYKIITPNAWFLTPRERLPILMDYFHSFGDTYSWLIILVGMLGSIALFRRSKRFFFSLILAFLISGPIFIFVIAAPIKSSDAIGVLERFYTLSFVLFAFFFPFGFVIVRDVLWFLLRQTLSVSIALALFFIIPILMIMYNFPKTDLSSIRIGNDLGRTILHSVGKKNAILFLHADTMTFDTWYMHYVEKVMPTITLVSIAESGNTYFQDTLVQQYKASHKNMSLSQDEMIGQMLPVLLKTHPIFSTAVLPYSVPTGYIQVPIGVTYQLLPKNTMPDRFDYITAVTPWLEESFLPRRETLSLAEQNLITPDITKFYSDSYYHMGNFLFFQYGDVSTAEKFYEKAIFIDNENTIPYANLATLQSLSANTCVDAEKHIRQAIYYYPIYRPYYISLYFIYKRCNANKAVLDHIQQQYLRIYRENIDQSPTTFYLFP